MAHRQSSFLAAHISSTVAHPFNADFYVAAVTVIPIFLIALGIQLRIVDAEGTVLQKQGLWLSYLGLRRFESIWNRLRFYLRIGTVLLVFAIFASVIDASLADALGFIALWQQSAPSVPVVLWAAVSLPISTAVAMWLAVSSEPAPIEVAITSIITAAQEAQSETQRLIDALRARLRAAREAVPDKLLSEHAMSAIDRELKSLIKQDTKAKRKVAKASRLHDSLVRATNVTTDRRDDGDGEHR